MRKLITFITAAAVLSLLAFTGGATAAGLMKDQVRSKHIKNGTIKVKDLNAKTAAALDESADLAKLESRVKALEDKLAAVTAGEVGAPFVPNPGATVTPTTITLTGGNTSAETPNLNRAVQAGDEISFDVAYSGGAVCTDGAPRMFVETQGLYTNSYDVDNSTNCAGGTAPPNSTNGTITFTVPNNGRIGEAGFVYDSGKPGTVTITNLKIDGKSVPFA